MVNRIENGPKELVDVMIQHQVYLEIYNTLQRIDPNRLQGTVHDRAIRLLEDIFHILDDKELDNEACIDRILALYYHEFECFPISRKDRCKVVLSLSNKGKEKDG